MCFFAVLTWGGSLQYCPFSFLKHMPPSHNQIFKIHMKRFYCQKQKSSNNKIWIYVLISLDDYLIHQSYKSSKTQWSVNKSTTSMKWQHTHGDMQTVSWDPSSTPTIFCLLCIYDLNLLFSAPYLQNGEITYFSWNLKINHKT